MVVYTWWCWHICKGGEVEVEMDQLGEEMEAKRVTRSDRTLAAEGPARLVMRSSEGRSIGRVT
jgi:hypothetical protein